MSIIEERFNNFVRLVEKLRSPEGCPWDRDQTTDSLKRYLLEETQETLEAIDNKDPDQYFKCLLIDTLHDQRSNQRRANRIRHEAGTKPQ